MLPISFLNVARYLTDSLRVPVLQTLRRGRQPELLHVSLLNVARYLTDTLRGPVLQTLRRARKCEFDGVGRLPKRSFNFFHFKIY